MTDLWNTIPWWALCRIDYHTRPSEALTPAIVCKDLKVFDVSRMISHFAWVHVFKSWSLELHNIFFRLFSELHFFWQRVQSESFLWTLLCLALASVSEMKAPPPQRLLERRGPLAVVVSVFRVSVASVPLPLFVNVGIVSKKNLPGVSHPNHTPSLFRSHHIPHIPYTPVRPRTDSFRSFGSDSPNGFWWFYGRRQDKNAISLGNNKKYQESFWRSDSRGLKRSDCPRPTSPTGPKLKI